MGTVEICAEVFTETIFIFVSAKLDYWVVIEYFLKHVVKEDILLLHCGRKQKVNLHFGSTGSHFVPEAYDLLH